MVFLEDFFSYSRHAKEQYLILILYKVIRLVDGLSNAATVLIQLFPSCILHPINDD